MNASFASLIPLLGCCGRLVLYWVVPFLHHEDIKGCRILQFKQNISLSFLRINYDALTKIAKGMVAIPIK